MGSLHNNVKSVVTKLLKPLSGRNKDIVSRRFGLASGQKETLESIGQGYKITRERVRQIENAALKQIKDGLKSGSSTTVDPYVNLAGSILEEHGGVMAEDDLFEKFSGSNESTALNAALAFFVTLHSDFVREGDSEDHNAFWALSEQHRNLAKKNTSDFISALKKNGILSENEVVDFYNNNLAAKDVSPKFVASLLNISKSIGRNNFGQVGLVSWPEIKPRGVRDRAYLVLKRDNKPRHFREIAELINSQGSWSRVANVQTVHNELIKDGRFVLVGRGLYALKEWGFKAGTVKDVIKDIMKNGNGPMTKDTVVKEVMSHRMVKENTIVLALQDRKVFSKNPSGTYSLREA